MTLVVPDKPILVTGATGKQGGAVVEHLLRHGAQVRALTRNPASQKAIMLASRGVEIVKGDLDNSESIVDALRGVEAVFAVQEPWAHGASAEIRQGKMLGDLAKNFGIRRFVQASVAAANIPTGVEHFESKGLIERHLQSLGLDVTAITPVLFMEAFVERLEPNAPYIFELLRRGLRGKSVQLIAVDDIGRVGAEALLENRPYSPGLRGIELAGDELTFDEIMKTYERVVLRRPKVAYLPMLAIYLLARRPYSSYKWMGEHGWHFDLDTLRVERPWLTAFEAWMRANVSDLPGESRQ